jgi:hypothetical protein
MIRGSRISEKARLMLGKDFPLKLEFRGENAFLALILAPRIAEE